ncbi:MAG: hypothetical protein JXR10_00110 [Cyclobacteriaceae bacterium]
MQLLTSLSQIGHLENDSVDLKIQKSFLVYLAIFMSFGGIVWGTICLMYDLKIQSAIPYGYLVISLFNMILFKTTKNFKVVRFIQSFISLALPFIFQWSLGGFSSSGTIMLWAILSLIASLSFQSISTSINWLFVYIILTGVSAFFNDEFRAMKPEVLPDSSILFVSINLVLISSIVFGLVVFFVQQYKKAELELQMEKESLKQANEMLARSSNTLKKAYNSLKREQQELAEQLDSSGENSKADFYENILKQQRKLITQFDQQANKTKVQLAS